MPEAAHADTASRALERRFEERFGRAPDRAARAPGRVNLIGEHTDYNGGLVLPCAIDRATRVVGAARGDGVVRIASENEGDEASFRIADAVGRAKGSFDHWSDYVRGVVFALAEVGQPPAGADLVVSSDVPIGAGLSSSAAFTVSLATLLSPDLSPRERAEAAHRAESHYLGVGSGILDQFASALCGPDEALLLDCRSRESRPVPLPPGAVCLLLADSGVRRSLADADSGYRARVRECGEALDQARAAGLVDESATSLRDLEALPLEQVEAQLAEIPFRRARHVLGENARVRRCCEAFAQGDLEAAGAVLDEGHASLRDDYEVSIPELDALCEIASGLPGVFGSRLTGAGFGGCTLHLVEPEAADRVGDALDRAFRAAFGRGAPVVRVRTAPGASLLEVAATR